jgi:hypothetical protein
VGAAGFEPVNPRLCTGRWDQLNGTICAITGSDLAECASRLPASLRPREPASLHGPPDDNPVCVKCCRQSQQLGSCVTVSVNEGEVNVVAGGITLQFAAQRVRTFGRHGVVPTAVEGGGASKGRRRIPLPSDELTKTATTRPRHWIGSSDQRMPSGCCGPTDHLLIAEI